ncbi:acyltransferase family protein [Nocardioides hwasunensis]|uniref:Acyltransferase n=1 Tax=Nocardioides hwasunensis TaxID=397258 RepID=A0ABR8MNX9_9ACTN|nr:acyltransferase [Nocardioides hwasunensis]MBD3916996.1 acyltransferase [Nocardioides hwasunensis]
MESRSPDARDQSVDCARGLAIVAIVLGHVERGLASASLMPYDTALTIDRLLYLFHLATFAYLSGLFVRRTVERDGALPTLRRRATLFVWLYLLWTVIQGSVRIAASSVANTPVTVGDIAKVWIPEGQLWFLPWLIAVTAVAALTQLWRSQARAAVVLVLAGVLAMAVWGFDPLYAFTRGWALLFPFLVGCVVTQQRHAAMARHLGVVVPAAVVGTVVWLGIGLATGAATPTTGGGGRTLTAVALGILGCAAGVMATLAVAALIARSPLAGVVALVGRRSLEIFLAHIVVASGARIVLEQAGVSDTWVHLVAATALGVVVPIVIAVAADRLRWSWVFGLPAPLERLAGHAQAASRRPGA